MRRPLRVCAVAHLGILFLLAEPGNLAIFAGEGATYVRKVRAVKTHERGAPNPAGLAFSPDANAFLVLQAGGTDRVALMSSFWDPLGSVSLGTGVPDPINVAWDGKVGRLLLLGTGRDELIEVALGPGALLHSSTITRARVPWSWPRGARGMTVDPATGTIFVLDGAARRVIRIEPDPLPGLDRESALRRGTVSPLPIADLAAADLRGIAFNPSDGHLYLLSPSEQKLYELTTTGHLVGSRDLASLVIHDPQGVVFAPSGDTTDDPAVMTLYIADTGLSATGQANEERQRFGRIIELSLIEPLAPLTSLAAVPSSLVNTILTSSFSPASPDPSGLAYIPSRGLVDSDGEVDEMSIYRNVNVWELTPGGSVTATSDTTSFSNEPTGVAYNPFNGHWFFTDDDKHKVFEVIVGGNGRPGGGDDTVTSFSTTIYGGGDPEGITYDTRRGHLFVSDGENGEIYEVLPGTGAQVSHFDTTGKGYPDVEGVEYNPDSDTLYICSHGVKKILETTVTGTIVREIDVSFLPRDVLSGLAYAPASNNPSVKDLYIADRGVDNNSNSNENDGRIYEVTLPGGTPCTTCPVCGNGARETGEICDGNDLGGQTCQSQGFSSGTLGCLSNCSGFDTSGCVTSNPNTVDVRVSASRDDAEESATGSVNLTSSDLELVFDASNQTVGMRFTGVPIARNAQISNAYIQFKVDEVQTETTQLNIQGQATDNPPEFDTPAGNVSSRPRTAASVPWPPCPCSPTSSVPPWDTVGVSQSTPNLAPIIQEIVNASTWTSGQSLVLIISGTGHRTAKSFEGEAAGAGAPLLHVELGSAVCGNGAREGGEQCDGVDIGSATCASQNCTGGTPSCTSSCTLSYSTCTGCQVCGNGTLEGSEQCDGSDLGGAACPSNCAGGTPSCTSTCTLSYTTCTGCPVCGNGLKETGEVCDGAALGGQTCQSQGFGSGTLQCLSNCAGFNTSGCSVCDLDGVCDAGENCNSCPNECIKSAPTCGNDVCETANGEDCRSCPSDCNGIQSGKPSKRYCCGDGDGSNPVGCGDARCAGNGNTCSSVATPVFCCGNGTCQSGETGSNCAIDCGP